MPRLTEDTPRVGGLRSWVQVGSYYVASGPAPGDVTLQNIALTEFVPFISFDYERFSLSSLETHLFCKREAARPLAVAWPLLKAYYAAFFAAHALMRATGRGVMRMEAHHARTITEVADTYGNPVSVTAGTFDFSLRQNADKTLDITLVRASERGGAHEGLWRSFYSFLTGLAEEVAATNEVDATQTIGEVAQIQRLMAANGMSSGTWLSAIRNQINYRHELDAWFPYGDAKAPTTLLDKAPIIDPTHLRWDVSAKKQPIEAFLTCCVGLSAINAQLTAIIRNRGAKRFDRLAKRLLKEAGLTDA